MIPFSNDKPRRLIPRWRDYNTTVASGELTSRGAPRETDSGNFRLENKIEEWKAKKNISSAVTLIEAASVSGVRNEEVISASDFLSNELTYSTPEVKRLARSLGVDYLRPTPASTLPRNKIAVLRQRLVVDPRDSLSWIDLARSYSSVGQNAKAERSIRAAIFLSSTNRFVLRSATRFFVHTGMADEAHWLLARSPATPHDPWLTAAEIATASLIDRHPRFVKGARRILELGRDSPRDLSELAGALATLEMESGKGVQARRLFRASLQDPTDNSLAQANWASREHNISVVDSSLVTKVPRAFEAASWQAYWAGEWTKSFEQALYWMDDEPFAASPATQATFLAISVLDDYAQGERIALRGLEANPTDPVLQNNLLVALLYQYKLERASKLYSSIHWPNDIDIHRPAAQGLMAFRKGDVLEGTKHYLSAVEIALERRNKILAMRAFLIFFREVSIAVPDLSGRIFRLAEGLISKDDPQEFQLHKAKLEFLASTARSTELFQRNVPPIEVALLEIALNGLEPRIKAVRDGRAFRSK